MSKLQQTAKKTLIIGFYAYVLGVIIYLILRTIFADRFWWLSLINSFSFYLFLPLILILPIALILKQKTLTINTTILLTIGMLWISPYFLPGAVHAANPNDTALRIVTFNVWGNNKRLSEVEQYIRDLKADLVVMQEIPASYATGKVPGLKDIYAHQLTQWEWGNLILSRFPFIHAEDITVYTGSTDQRVVISVGGEEIAVYNIHLPCPPCNKPRIELPGPWFINMPFAYDDTHRNEVLQGLVTLLDKETLPYIVAGDFNMSAQSPSYCEIAKRAKDAFYEAGSGLGFSWPVEHEVSGFPSFIPPLIRIDYIWYSPHFDVINVQQGQMLGSDHLPLWATLKLKQGSP